MNIPEIFVLWHPRCKLGEVLARDIYAWLRPGNGLGPQVYYRSLPAPGAPPDGLPPPLPGDPCPRGKDCERSELSKVSNLQILLVLIDEHMVCDRSWRYWLARLREADPAQRVRVIMPVALDATAYNMPDELRQLNYLRPAGLPLPNADNAIAAYDKVLQATRLCQQAKQSDKDRAANAETAIHSLLKQLTEALTRQLLPLPSSADSVSPVPLKVTIFLSHAKIDGREPAQRLRDYIYSQTQMAAFYDENDIAFSSVFEKVLETSLESPTMAAMIAVQSAAYARRPWCRREVAVFRRPRLIPIMQSDVPNRCEQWNLHPLLVLEAMDGGTDSFGIPEFGNAPIVRWSETAPHIEEQIVTRVIRDALLASYHGALATTIPKAPNRIVLNWVPDPTTLLHVVGARTTEDLEIVHPGHGLSYSELKELRRLFPRLTFRSFEGILS